MLPLNPRASPDRRHVRRWQAGALDGPVFNVEEFERFVAGDPVQADAALDACVGGRCAPSASSGRAGALSRAAGKLMERLMAS